MIQNSLASWIEDVGSDDNDSGSEDDSTDGSDNQAPPPVTSDDMSGSGTDEEDQVPSRLRNPILIHKHPRANPCTTSIQ